VILVYYWVWRSRRRATRVWREGRRRYIQLYTYILNLTIIYSIENINLVLIGILMPSLLLLCYARYTGIVSQKGSFLSFPFFICQFSLVHLVKHIFFKLLNSIAVNTKIFDDIAVDPTGVNVFPK
jgi:hypothetical protein